RSLLDGDLVLSIVERPDLEMDSPDSFISAVGPLPPGKVLHLVIVRQGQQMTVPVTLDAKPSELVNAVSEEVIEQFNSARVKVAEEYWDKEFSRLGDDPASSAK